jgi:hypothetical protein
MEKMTVDRPALAETHKKFGLYTGLALAVVLAIIYVVKVQNAAWVRYVPVVLIAGGILGNAFAFSRANGGAVTFGQIFTSCFKATAILTLIVMAWTLLSTYVFPEIDVTYKDLLRRTVEGEKGLSAAERTAALTTSQKYSRLIFTSEMLFPCMFMGLISSLIGGAVAPKNQMPV